MNKSPHILLLQPQQDDSQKVFDLIKRAVSLELPSAITNTIDDLQNIFRPSPQTITDAVSEADLIIGNMDGGNLSVTFGLGIAVSKNKPILLIAPAGRAMSVPLDLFKNRLFIFSLDDPELFVESFKFQVKDSLDRKSGEPQVPSINNVFISYSHTDNDFLQRLLVHLRPLDRANLIRTWVDTRLRPGDDWEAEISRELESSRVAILLVSADFMASKFIVENELPPLLAKAEADGTRIIPIVVKPCRFTRDKHLSRFQAANEPRKPLISLSEAEKKKYTTKLQWKLN